MPVIATAAARKLIGSEAVEEVAGDFRDFGIKEDELVKLMSSAAVEAVASQEAAEDSMKSFKEFLKEIAADVAGQTVEHDVENLWGDDEDRKKLIILVDELDRCRPTYAVEVLECIKHLFAVDGVVFVLAIDDKQMKNALSSVYGVGLDGDGYLRKFIDWQYFLPPADVEQYVSFLGKRFGLDSLPNFKNVEDFHRGIDSLAQGFGMVSLSYGLSLREAEQGMAIVNLIARTARDDQIPFSIVLGTCVGLSLKHKKFIKDAVNDFGEAKKLIEEMGANFGQHSKAPKGWGPRFQNIFLSWFVDDQVSSELNLEKSRLIEQGNAFNKNLTPENSEKQSAIREKVENITQILKFSEARDSYNIWSGSIAAHVIKGIETARGFL